MFKLYNRCTLFKGFLAACAVVLLFPIHSSAKENETSEMKTVQHVYVDDDFVGSLTDDKGLQSSLEEKVEDTKAAYPDAVINADSQVTLIPEQMFEEPDRDSLVIDKVIHDLKVKADAYEIMIGDEGVAYVSSKADAEEVIKSILLQYVTEKELEQYEGKKQGEVNDTQESRVTDILLSKSVESKAVHVDPAKLIDVKEAIEVINEGTHVNAVYETKDEETLADIEDITDVEITRLLELNPDINDETKLESGTELQVEVPVSYLDIRVEREVFRNKKIAFETKIIKDEQLYEGEKKTDVKGKPGNRVITYKTIEMNGQPIEETVTDDRVASEAVTQVEREGTKEVPSRGTGTFAWPADGGYISSKQGQRWGKLHKGIDIARPVTKTITAADNGVVEFAGIGSGYGNMVIIDHKNGYKTTYAHLDSLAVHSGQVVPKGTKIGVMGSTGHSTGVHLHFEIHKNGALADPLKYINQ
ncbi:M23 family metallopeptidase [Peribacillus psychrosaccharolyticus]|uniref:M23 family metallopeptidase n=1 Tax=Peribacillus psychrosaccharolyticus TaxID=1407 RepID=A0A974NJL8_PERPY|nr:M23 family metallopeptidase [Peribacillus psychrosaccharolyticus]MEC2055174.1 M23 family metallopeptidase [Peribacillus psychrosaccharolyticus]MED3745164.1 M23 family metallopeptidase [Peribacillus psychrosaccharolyticus]QQS98889.1 M23 family metallopeptidase [Peribacillus psychrosaccharolyticus]